MNKFKIAIIIGLVIVVSLSATMIPRASVIANESNALSKIINSRNASINYDSYFNINTDF